MIWTRVVWTHKLHQLKIIKQSREEGGKLRWQSFRVWAWSQPPASSLMARCAIQHIRLILRKVVFFFLCRACAKVNMYFGTEPVSAFKFPGDRLASRILCEHPALQAFKHQLVHGVICMLILLLFSTHPTCICAKKIILLRWKVKCCLCALPFRVGFSWTIKAFWDKWLSKEDSRLVSSYSKQSCHTNES